MKKIVKLISGGLVASSAFIPLTTLSGCGLTKYDKITEEMKKQVIDEFTSLSKCYRPTYHTKAICQYIEKWATDNGFSPVNDSATYKPDVVTEDNGYNIYFDVPASNDGSNIPGIILQGHTDMVVVGDVESLKANGVIPVIDSEGKKMYSKDHKTSLGADNGIGVACMLVLAKNKDKFTHGPIRMLFTTDEEDGTSGAEQVPNNWFDNFNHLINCDSEEVSEMSVACGGAIQSSVPLTGLKFDKAIPSDYGIYDINISGLLGGHSAIVVGEGHINAIKLIGKILYSLNYISDEGKPINIISGWDGPAKDGDTHGGTIPSKYTMRICCALSQDKINEYINTIVQQSMKDHPVEKNLKVDVVKVDKSKETRKVLNDDDTHRLIKLLILIPYGIYSYGKYGVQTSNNLSALRIRDTAICEDKDVVYMETFGRSFDSTKLPYLQQEYNAILHDENTFGIYKKDDKYLYNFTPFAVNYPWVSDDNNAFQQIILDGAKAIKQDLKKTAYGWWLEPGAFARKAKEASKEMHMASIGVTVRDPHSVNETIELETINPLLKMTLYTLENLKK